MINAKHLRRFYEANMAYRDIAEAKKARMLADIATAAMEQVHAFFVQAIKQHTRQAA